MDYKPRIPNVGHPSIALRSVMDLSGSVRDISGSISSSTDRCAVWYSSVDASTVFVLFHRGCIPTYGPSPIFRDFVYPVVSQRLEHEQFPWL